MKTEFKSRVYTDRPSYADFDAPAKFEAIKSIIAKRLIEHPNAICSYSGGSDSDIMIHIIEQVRKLYNLPSIQYAFFNTGLEMEATKRHVKEIAEQYGVEIKEYRPWNIFGDSYIYRQKYNIYKAARMAEEKMKVRKSV